MKIEQACKLEPSLKALQAYFHSSDKGFSREIDCQPLEGGLTNRCWRIKHQQKNYVWRPVSQASECFGLSRLREQQSLLAINKRCQSAGKARLAPDVIVKLPQGLLVEWVEGTALSQSLDPNYGLHAALAIVCSLHALVPTASEVKNFCFHFSDKVDDYWHQIDKDQHGTWLNETVYPFYQQWREVATPIDPSELRWCHFDLGRYNLIQANDGVRAIDWEYCAIADPAIELALMTQIYDIEPRYLVEHYCQSQTSHQADQWLTRVEQWQPRVRLLAMLWYIVAYQIASEPSFLQTAQQMSEDFC